MDERETPVMVLKRENAALKKRSRSLIGFINHLRYMPEHVAQEMLQRLRATNPSAIDPSLVDGEQPESSAAITPASSLPLDFDYGLEDIRQSLDESRLTPNSAATTVFGPARTTEDNLAWPDLMLDLDFHE